MTENQMHTIKDFGEMLTKQIDKIVKKGDITPDELMRMDKAVDIIKDIQVICAMEEYGKDPEMEMYSSTGYYGHNSRGYMPVEPRWNYSAEGNYSGRRRGYSRDEAAYKMRSDLEQKLAMANDEREREMITKCLRALDN